MIPPTFDYHRATSIADAVETLIQAGPDARPLAGGQSLVAMLKLRFAQPSTLVDLSGIDDLKVIEAGPNAIRFGAMATHDQVISSVRAERGMKSFADVGRVLGDMQVRSQGTMGGSIAHADPAGDWPAVALAHDATIEIVGSGGPNDAPIDSFFLGPLTTVVKPGQLITAITIPTTATASAYIKIADPASGYARAGVCAVVTQSGDRYTYRVAATGASSHPFRMKTVEAAANASATTSELTDAADADVPPSSTAEADPYRRQLLRVAVSRAIEEVNDHLLTRTER